MKTFSTFGENIGQKMQKPGIRSGRKRKEAWIITFTEVTGQGKSDLRILSSKESKRRLICMTLFQKSGVRKPVHPE
jgi:hypothetical protein